MPHLKLEYTENIDLPSSFEDLFSELHQGLAESGDIDINNCKSRAFKLQDYLLSKNGKGPFVHLEVAILSGRAPDVITRIGDRLKSILVHHFVSTTGIDDLQVTIELREFNRNNYFKYS